MPGIITHFKVFNESVDYLSNRHKKSYLLRSIESLFSSDLHIKAALFGSIGPNIFDYNLKKNKRVHYGNEVSFFLHDGGSKDLISYMIDKIKQYKDYNNEWASIQRAYLYGYIAHIICDAYLNPFIFYWSGFPETYKKEEINYYREQNLLFKYNIDNYFLYSDEAGDMNFDIQNFIPLHHNGGLLRINPAIKSLILESLNKVYPEIYTKLVWVHSKDDDKKFKNSFGVIDMIPYLIKFTYWMKRKRSKHFINFLKKIKRNNLLFSDFIVQYPLPKIINKHVLNFHKERWQYPSSKSGYHYESVENQLQLACDKVVEVWEKIESLLYGNNKLDVIKDIDLNAYTGLKDVQYHEMNIKNPIRLYF